MPFGTALQVFGQGLERNLARRREEQLAERLRREEAVRFERQFGLQERQVESAEEEREQRQKERLALQLREFLGPGEQPLAGNEAAIETLLAGGVPVERPTLGTTEFRPGAEGQVARRASPSKFTIPANFLEREAIGEQAYREEERGYTRGQRAKMEDFITSMQGRMPEGAFMSPAGEMVDVSAGSALEQEQRSQAFQTKMEQLRQSGRLDPRMDKAFDILRLTRPDPQQYDELGQYDADMKVWNQKFAQLVNAAGLGDFLLDPTAVDTEEPGPLTGVTPPQVEGQGTMDFLSEFGRGMSPTEGLSDMLLQYLQGMMRFRPPYNPLPEPFPTQGIGQRLVR